MRPQMFLHAHVRLSAMQSLTSRLRTARCNTPAHPEASFHIGRRRSDRFISFARGSRKSEVQEEDLTDLMDGEDDDASPAFDSTRLSDRFIGTTSKVTSTAAAAAEQFGATKIGGLQIYKADFTVNSILDKIRRGKLDLRPSYQREYVWTVRTASRLIESLLLNVPVPTMFFHETPKGHLEVVDGKQRLTSIWSYVEGFFPDGSEFSLTGLEVFYELNGKKFNDLSEFQQETLLDYALNVHTISRSCEPDFVFEVFERLNMGATQLNEQELRNCIYQGRYTELLQELSQNKYLKDIFNSTAAHLRMKDREMVLRFFAMYNAGPLNFKTPVKQWLNSEIRKNVDLSDSMYEDMKLLFETTIRLCYDVLGTEAFRAVKEEKGEGGSVVYVTEKTEVNVAVFDTVMYAFTQFDEDAVMKKKDEIAQAYKEYFSRPSTRRQLVSQTKPVVDRYTEWQKIMEDILL